MVLAACSIVFAILFFWGRYGCICCFKPARKFVRFLSHRCRPKELGSPTLQRSDQEIASLGYRPDPIKRKRCRCGRPYPTWRTHVLGFTRLEDGTLSYSRSQKRFVYFLMLCFLAVTRLVMRKGFYRVGSPYVHHSISSIIGQFKGNIPFSTAAEALADAGDPISVSAMASQELDPLSGAVTGEYSTSLEGTLGNRVGEWQTEAH